MTGILYGVGVGPGDPELMTLKAVRLIRENEIIALPGAKAEETAAYQIAAAAVPEIAKKRLLSVCMPMTHDKEKRQRCHREGAKIAEDYLRDGKNVIFLTLGDPAIYSTFTYIQQIVEADGFETRLVSGVPSFCAAAARVGQPLAVWNEPIHIYPAVHRLEEHLPESGACVLMKSGRRMKQVKELVKQGGWDAVMVENCGTEGERVCSHVDEMPDEAGYYSLVIAKKA